jgi:hypothetical protein
VAVIEPESFTSQTHRKHALRPVAEFKTASASVALIVSVWPTIVTVSPQVRTGNLTSFRSTDANASELPTSRCRACRCVEVRHRDHLPSLCECKPIRLEAFVCREAAGSVAVMEARR